MDQELKIELAARKLCELRGIDADKRVPHGAEPNEHGIVPMVLLHSPAWQLVAREIRARMQVDEALAFAEAASRGAARGGV